MTVQNPLEDARQAYKAWQEAPQGSYVERTMADSIVRDIVPALIHVAERKAQPIGFQGDAEVSAIATETEIDHDDAS